MKNERKRTFLLITIPILALFVCFNTIPLIRGVIYSFTNFKGFGTYDWVGLRNYMDLFTDSRVGGSYLFTFKLAICATIITNVISLILALGLNSKIRAKGFFRAAYFLPNVLGALVVGYVFQYLFTYILPALRRDDRQQDLSPSLLSNEKHCLVRHHHCLLLAEHCHEHHHLHLRTSDRAGGRVRGRFPGRSYRLEAVQTSDLPADHSRSLPSTWCSA